MHALILAAALLSQTSCQLNGMCSTTPTAMFAPPLPAAGYAFPQYQPAPFAYAPVVSTPTAGCPFGCNCPGCTCARSVVGYAVPSAPVAYSVSQTTTVGYAAAPRRGFARGLVFRPLRAVGGLFKGGGCCR